VTSFSISHPVNEAKLDNQLFDELYGALPQAIFWMKPVWNNDESVIIDFRYIYCNEAGLKYLNLTSAQYKGLHLSTSPMVNDSLRKAALQELAEVFVTNNDVKRDVYNPVRNKYARLLRIRLRDGVLSVVEDRTEENRIIRQLELQAEELKEKSQQLQEQKNLLDNILINSSNGISVSRVFRDESGKVVDALTILANDAAVKYIGLPKDIYLSQPATKIEPGIIDSPYYQACIKTLETGEPFVMQYEIKSTGRWLELTVSKLDYDHLIQIFTDITNIKEAQLQLEKAAATLRTVFDAAQTGMFTFAPEYNDKKEIIDFRFVMVNTTISQYAGQTPEALEGELGVKWFPGYLTNGEFDMYKHCFATGEQQRTEIHYNIDSHDFYLDLQTVKIDDQLLVTLTDYSTLRKSQLELEHTVKALERSNAHLEDFAHAASHDMKEPLRKIHTFADRLKQMLGSRMNETESNLFQRMITSAERMQILVEDLLEFSHVSTQSQEIEAVDLSDKLKKVLSDLELSIEEKQAKVEIGHLPTVQGNRRQLQQLFQNLISNALKYHQQNIAPLIQINSTTVNGADSGFTVTTEDQQTLFYLVEIKDNGIGFEQQYADRIFNIFTRLHGRSEYAGTGVGLAIVQKVVENHNGYIFAEGKPGIGATFKVLLPV
jgi:signal transduction histidine kinase/PAS domain-containing protein